MLSLFFSMFCQSAIADELQITTGWYFYAIGDNRSAAAISKKLLEENPNDLAAHNLHITARSRSDSFFSSHLYQVWYDENPDDPVVSIALAMALIRERETEGVSELLHLDSDDPELLYWSLRFEEKRRGRSKEDTAEVTDQLVAFGAEHSFAQYYRLRELFEKKEACNEALQQEFEEYIKTHPWQLEIATRLWSSDEEATACQQKIQKKALSLAKKQAKSKEAVEVYAALRVLERGENKKLSNKAREHLLEIDPERKAFILGEDPDEDLHMQIYDANARPTHELAIKALEEISKELPQEGPLRATYDSVLQDRYEAMGKKEEALQAAYRASLNSPDDANKLNGFAYEASKSRMMLTEALEASSRSIELQYQETYEMQRGRTYSSWLSSQNYSLSAYLDTRGWIYYQQGEYSKARQDLEEALHLKPSQSVQKAHLGLVLYELGEKEIALQILLEALDSGIPEEQLTKDSEAKVTELFSAVGVVWSPGSFEEYWKAVQEGQKLEGGDSDEPEKRSTHSMIGQKIPIDSFEVIRGDTDKLSDFDGQLMVIDLWATWCGPCIKGMPHLQEVAAEYKDKGVNIIGLSVDQEKEKPEIFFTDFAAPAYTVGWIGADGFDTFDIRGIPSLFIIDEEGVIVEYFSGYSPGSTRLEETIERLLQ